MQARMIRISIPNANESLSETLVAEIQREQQAAKPRKPLLRVCFDDVSGTMTIAFGDHQAQVMRFPRQPVSQYRRAA